MKIKENRKVRGYKITDTQYNKAMRRAKREKASLATLIEVWVISYGAKMPYYIESNSPIYELGEPYK